MDPQNRKILRLSSMQIIRFNREIEVDVMFVDGDPVLHIIDRSKKYSVAKFLKNKTAEHTQDLKTTRVYKLGTLCTGGPAV